MISLFLFLFQVGTGLAYSAPPGFKACQPDDVEAILLEREKSLIGPTHAMQHLHMRKHQCEVERGTRKVPGKGIEMKASQTLVDDDTAKKAAWKRNTDVSQIRNGATVVIAGLTGSTRVNAQAVSTDPLVVGRSVELTFCHSGGGRHGRTFAHGQSDVLVL